MTNDEKENIIRGYIAAYNRFDIDGMVTRLHPEVCFVNMSSDEVNAEARGVDQFRQLAIESGSMFSSRVQNVLNISFDHDQAIVDIDFEGVLAEDVPGFAASGQTVHCNGTSMFEFRDEKIAKITDAS